MMPCHAMPYLMYTLYTVTCERVLLTDTQAHLFTHIFTFTQTNEHNGMLRRNIFVGKLKRKLKTVKKGKSNVKKTETYYHTQSTSESEIKKKTRTYNTYRSSQKYVYTVYYSVYINFILKESERKSYFVSMKMLRLVMKFDSFLIFSF